MVRSYLKFAAIGLLAIGSSACAVQAEAIAVDGAFSRTLRVNGPIDLDVLSRAGRIRVHAGLGGVVQIDARIRAYGSLRLFNVYTPSEQVNKLEAAPPVEQQGNTITIGRIDDEALAQNVSISYELTVPTETRLRTLSRSGDQTIEAIEGPVTASSRSGRIEIANVANALDVNTRSGDVDVRSHTKNVRVVSRSGRVMLEGNPSQSWTVETRSGDVEAQVSNAEIDVDSRSGSVESQRPIQVRGGKSRHQLQGTIGTGGGRFEVSTRSGSVTIR